MLKFLILVHGDAKQPIPTEAWMPYLGTLKQGNHLIGGSAVAGGWSITSTTTTTNVTDWLRGFHVIIATSVEEAKRLVATHPVVVAGGTVELRELPATP